MKREVYRNSSVNTNKKEEYQRQELAKYNYNDVRDTACICREHRAAFPVRTSGDQKQNIFNLSVNSVKVQ